MADLLVGQVLSFAADPFAEGPGAARIWERGGVLVEAGRIAALGDAASLAAAHPDATRHDYGAALISAGFIDAHMHYPQTAIIASWGKRLIDWLATYTFPEEARFADPAYCAEIAGRYLDMALAQGTTSMCSFATIHPASVDAFFTAAEARQMRVLAGKTCMDRNAPADLRDTAEAAYDQSRALLQRWHGVGRARYVITPRFAPTSSPAQLAALGALWAEHPDCLMQTHLSEQTDEVAWVAALYPKARDYLDVYESAGLLGPNAIFGHAIHLTTRERARLAEVGAAVAHCPTSNSFIGSGLFDMAGLKRDGLRVGLATDTGGGSSFSMLRTMAAAYEIAQLRHVALHPSQLIWLATAGSAAALGLGQRIGSLLPGHEADLVVLDLASTPAIAQRSARANDLWEALFPTIMMGDDRAIRATWVNGRLAHARALA
ncbi:guanine deaminase [Phaeovulum sp.]|uniref:guanine deaminase n=1 Tax=Phaeovulum sp. TaxID=2934796 RepID=UPI00272F784A|nr:guanine deaminase [Phaeovulum sp.]MDP1668546.1 guanine deaminase [Phaeovulum sp.]MDP2062547.1 guanine deaminase [Phaeovulum sp.]MDZ4118829.1 guanine deaminase [Phaeovulum sp.]